MEHSATKGDDRLKGKCIDETEGRGTDINAECIQAAKEATFMDRYNVTVTYNEKVGMGGGQPLINLFICIVSVYSLGAGRSGVRNPIRAKFSALVQTGSEAHPACCTMDTGSTFPGVKQSGRGVDHPAPPSVEVKERAEQCLYFPLRVVMACYRENLAVFVYFLLFVHLFTFLYVRISFLSFFTSSSTSLLFIYQFYYY